MNAPPTTERTDPLIGALLVDRFRIHARLGAGGFGVVYRASQLSIDRMVAIKVLGLRASGPAARGRFLREAQVLSRLASPHTVRLIDFGILDDGRFFYVMEYLEGETLEDLIARGPVPVDVALRIAEQICHALQEAHGQQIVHRDLKPANIWLQQVSGDRVVRLLDFGTARLLDADEVTRSEVLIGTPAYLAPEQCRSAEVDARVDLYGLGLILFEMVAGRHAFGEGVLAEMIHHHVYTTPPALGEQVDGVPPALGALVARLLAKRPEARPASAWAVRLEIERLLAGRGSARVMGLAPTAVFDVISEGAAADGEAREERSTRRIERASLQAILAAPTGATLAWSRDAMPSFDASAAVGERADEGAPTVRVGSGRPWAWGAGLLGLLGVGMALGWVILQWLPRPAAEEARVIVIGPPPGVEVAGADGGGGAVGGGVDAMVEAAPDAEPDAAPDAGPDAAPVERTPVARPSRRAPRRSGGAREKPPVSVPSSRLPAPPPPPLASPPARPRAPVVAPRGDDIIDIIVQ